MTQQQFTISKLNNLINNIQSILDWMENVFEINSKLPNEFEEKHIMLPYLVKQKELYLKTIENIKNIISSFNKIEDEESPYSNHLLLQTFNIMDSIGTKEEIYNYCCFGEFIEKEE